MNLKPGVILQKGKYTIDSILGQGGFGITYRAIHHQHNQIVVLKTLNESLRHHQDFAKFKHQFIDEVHLLTNSRHPNIVRVWDFFEEEQFFFMVMDYIPGQNLADLIQSGHKLHPNEAIDYVHQIASALSVVHKNGFLHRDIQPKNIIRQQGTNTVILTDFGITCDLTAGIRQTYANLFSVGYAAPEQCDLEQKLTPAADIYALTATLYYLLTGKAPTPAALRLSDEAIPQTLIVSTTELRLLETNLSPNIENAIIKGLEIDPQKRPQTLDNWFALLLDKSDISQVSKQKYQVKESCCEVNSNYGLMDTNFKSNMNNKVTNDFSNQSKIKNYHENKAPINILKNCSLENNFNWINQLSLQLTIFLVFLFTAATFGWIGFDITLRYSYAKANKKTVSLTGGNLLETLKNESEYAFREHDPSSPLFDSPSVKTYSTTPPKLNKLPKPYVDTDEVFPNSGSNSSGENYQSYQPYYSSDLKIQIPSHNYSVNEEIYSPEKLDYPSDHQSKPLEYNYQKYQQQNQYPDDYY
ncbi:MAG: serine/threonine protein kinase [Okeania sp. SIO2C2]|uniref:serine/threonine protein kinase n=1 Tax=Okeania sp. SIO2C2 TaxID=2607787 RepID=UPI0013BCEF95|nr:serine/threonine-protein kinase [Okeania sp. SIO2C2]NEP87614.1 serine/threonine protein kinase [Okeania sp. SIO2C2]